MTTLGLNQPSINSTSWGGPMNANIGSIDTGTALGQINLYSPISVSGTTTLTSSAFGHVHELSGTTSAYTVTLPSAATGNIGSLIAFRGLPSASLNQVVTIQCGGTDTIEGLGSMAMLWEEFCVLLCSASGRWTRIIWKTLDIWQPFTPTFTAVTTNPSPGGTPTQNCYWKRDANDMIIQFYYQQTVAGSAGSGNYKIALPLAGISIDSKCNFGQIASASNWPSMVGSGWSALFNVTGGSLQVFTFDSQHIGILALSGASASIVSGTYYSLGDASVFFSFQARVPISGWG
jgi:hypothetical protein